MRKAFIKQVLGLSLCIFITQLSGVTLEQPFTLTPNGDSLPRYFPDVAYSTSAGVWLAVWQDGDPTGDETSRNGSAQDIFCARIDTNGTVLDQVGIPVCTAADFQERPKVVSDGVDFLVVWHDMRNGSDWDVYGARVTSAGVVRDTNGFLMAGGDKNQCFPDLAYGSGQYYVAWLNGQNSPEYRVYGGRISRSGSLLDSPAKEVMRFLTDAGVALWQGAPLAPGKLNKGWHNYSKQPGPPSVAANDSVFIVTSFLDFFGTTGPSDPAATSNDYHLRAVSPASGEPLGVVSIFRHSKESLGAGIQVKSVKMGLCKTGDKSHFISATHGFDNGFGSDGVSYWGIGKVYPDGQPMSFRRLLTRDTTQLAVGYRSLGVKRNVLDLAFDGQNLLFVANSMRHAANIPRGGNVDIVALTTDANGNLVNSLFEVAAGTDYQDEPAAAAGPQGKFLVVWQSEAVSIYSQIKGRIVTVR